LAFESPVCDAGKKENRNLGPVSRMQMRKALGIL
jgi:hypothetical protein